MGNDIYTPQKAIVLYSVGLLGGSIGIALKKSGYAGRIIGLSSPANIKTALSLGCIDEGYDYDKLNEIIKDTDVIFLCSPIKVIIETLTKLAKIDLPKNLIITDVGSTKKEIAEAAKNILPKHVHFLGGHPMAGSEKRGPSAADPYLFQNAIYVLSPLTEKPAEIDIQFARFLEHYLGCRHIILKPEIHDTIAATVSHIPHMLAVSLVNLAQEIEDQTPSTLHLAAGGFRDLTRIASAPYKMWHDIFLTNKKTIAPLLDQCMEILRSLKKKLIDNDLEESFNNAAETRRKIPLHNKGFMTPLYEILVLAKDQPGVLASMTNILAIENLNIKDIEVLKMREGEGGTIKMAFNSYETANAAAEVLNKSGFSAWERK